MPQALCQHADSNPGRAEWALGRGRSILHRRAPNRVPGPESGRNIRLVDPLRIEEDETRPEQRDSAVDVGIRVDTAKRVDGIVALQRESRSEPSQAELVPAPRYLIEDVLAASQHIGRLECGF